MQTKRKRKQWALLAFTMITAFMMQAITPLTVKAEEKIYTYSDFATLKRCEVGSSALYGPYHNEYISNLTITSNTPIKIGIIERSISDTYYRDGYWDCVIFCKDVTNIEFTYMRDWADFCDPCKYEDTHTARVWTYNSDSFKELYNSDGEVVGYYKKLFSSFQSVFDYYGVSDDKEINYSHADINNDLITYYANYGKNEEQNDCVLRGEDYNRFLKEVADGTIPPMNNGQFDESTAIYDTSIPTPNITVKNDYSFGFNNACDNYYFQVKGRWYSVDDIEFYKDKAVWKYKYHSYIKSNLTDWVTTSEKALTSTQDLNFATFGKSAFESFLSYYPVDNRSLTGGTDILGNFFNRYEDAKNTIKMLLKEPTSVYNGLEIYIRYYTFDENGIVHYGKWCHYFDNLANASGSTGSQWDDKENMFTGNQSQDGLTDSDLGNLENTNDSKNDIDVVPEYNDDGFSSVILGDVDASSLVTALESMYGQTKSFINMIGLVFNFLPPWIITLICASIGLVCVIGIWKCVRG